LPYADPVEYKKYQTKWHKENDNRIHRARRLKRMIMLERIKLEETCKHCGFNENPKALQFHHIDPSKKNFTISRFLNKKLIIILRETELCDVLCANCHIIEEYRLNDKSLY